MKKHQNKTLTTALGLLCLGVLFLGGFFLYHIFSINTEINSIKTEAQDSIKKSQQISSVRTVLRESSATLKEIDAVFVQEDLVPSFIDSLEALAVRKGVSLSISSINIDPLVGSKVGKQLRLRASSSGSWDEVVSFFTSLESLSKAVSVQSLSLSKEVIKKDDKESVLWNASMEISVLVISK